MTYRILTKRSNTLKWRRLRKLSGIGASEMAAILGDTSWGTPLSVWQEKTAKDVVDIGTKRMEWGHRLESVILAAVTWDHPEVGQVVASEGLLQCVEFPWLIGTLDAQLDSVDHGRVPLEAKNVSAHQKRDWIREGSTRCIAHLDCEIDVPPKYRVQVLQQAFIQNDAAGGYVAVLFDGNDLHVIWVPRSQAFIDEKLIGVGGDFWNHNVVKRIAPAPILGDDLAALWPITPKKEREADSMLIEEMRPRWIDAKARQSQADDDVEALAFWFGLWFEDAELAVDANGNPIMRMGSRRGQQRVKVATHAEQHPDCVDCVTQDRTSRTPFAVIEKPKSEPKPRQKKAVSA
ncbi:MAG: hypothetical protein JWP85_2091 [Rhodoglobus sp.]|nr:hypothetical protein [Rhodoglobus sp.]